jgi:tmRNA-binding protein
VELALVRGKKLFDKREVLKEQQSAREMQRMLRHKE